MDTDGPGRARGGAPGAGAALALARRGGEPLHRRGYRVRPTAAPLKETLAAAVLARRRLHGRRAAVRPDVRLGHVGDRGGADRRAARAGRAGGGFGIERWPELGAQARGPLDGAEGRGAGAASGRRRYPIVGSRPRPGGGARRRSETPRRRRLAREVGVTRRTPLATAAGAVAPGLLVTNPPYGDRLTAGGQKGMKTFYFKLGERLGALPGGGWPSSPATPPSRAPSTPGPRGAGRCGTGPSAASCSATPAPHLLVGSRYQPAPWRSRPSNPGSSGACGSAWTTNCSASSSACRASDSCSWWR